MLTFDLSLAPADGAGAVASGVAPEGCDCASACGSVWAGPGLLRAPRALTEAFSLSPGEFWIFGSGLGEGGPTRPAWPPRAERGAAAAA